MNVAIVDYGSGNLCSAAKAFEQASNNGGKGFKVVVTNDPEKVANSDRIVLPGVGAFGDCKRGVSAIDGMMESLTYAVDTRGIPFMGICVGMQLMATQGSEHETVEGFGWIPGEVKLIEPEDKSLKVPHMGWNTIECIEQHPILEGISTGPSGQHAYFVHSYNFDVESRKHLVAEFNYAGSFTAIVGRDNLVGTQFHPEKSQKFGLRLIKNFLNWSP